MTIINQPAFDRVAGPEVIVTPAINHRTAATFNRIIQQEPLCRTR